MKLLKASVIGMGALILVGLTVVIVTVVNRYGGGAEKSASPATAPVLSVPVERGFGERRITLPQGAEAMETQLGDGRIVVRLRLADRSAALLVLDAATGERLGLVRLDPR